MVNRRNEIKTTIKKRPVLTFAMYPLDSFHQCPLSCKEWKLALFDPNTRISSKAAVSSGENCRAQGFSGLQGNQTPTDPETALSGSVGPCDPSPMAILLRLYTCSSLSLWRPLTFAHFLVRIWSSCLLWSFQNVSVSLAQSLIVPFPSSKKIDCANVGQAATFGRQGHRSC